MSRNTDKPPSQANAVCLGHYLALDRGHSSLRKHGIHETPRVQLIELWRTALGQLRSCTNQHGIHEKVKHLSGRGVDLIAAVASRLEIHVQTHPDLPQDTPQTLMTKQEALCLHAQSEWPACPATSAKVGDLKHGNGCTKPTQAQHTTTDAASACMSV